MDSIIREMIALSEDIYRHPELGYKEVNTAAKVKAMLDKHGIPHRDIACTGILATLDSGRPGPHIGLVAELDAVPTLGHPYANPADNAAHTCGHYAQLGVMLSVLAALKEKNALGTLCGKATLVCTPAEEFCDLDYRKGLIAEGKISHCSGKQEMIELGVFEDMDVLLSCHAMGLDMNRWHAEVGAGLNGFLCKRATYHGRSAHAGSNPAGGINALNAITLSMTAMNFLRETFREEDAVRVHWVVKDGGQTVNTIPSRTSLEMYVRAKTVPVIQEINQKVDNCLRAGALATGCDLEIVNTPGYLPLHQDKNLTDFVVERIRKYVPDEMIAHGTHGFASGDMGDLSMLYPTIEIGVAGFTGTLHGVDFRTADEEQAYAVPAKYFYDSVCDLLANNGKEARRIREAFTPELTREAYLKTLKDMNKTANYTRGENA